MTQIRNVTTSAAVLGQVLAGARNIRGLKQSDVGAALGIGASSWSRIEKGDASITYKQLRVVAKLLKMSVGEIDELTLAAEKEVIEKKVEIDDNLIKKIHIPISSELYTMIPFIGSILGVVMQTTMNIHRQKVLEEIKKKKLEDD